MKALICIRQLPFAEPTLKFGALVSGLEDASITLMTVVPDRRQIEEAEALLQKATDLIDVEIMETRIRFGQPIEEILKESRESQYDLIIVGTHEVENLLQALFGSITEKVVHKAGSSVLVAKRDSPELKRILIPIGGQKLKKRVIRAGAGLAKEAGAEVTVLYVTSPVPSMYTGLETIEETLEELLQTDTPIANHLRWSANYLNEQGITAHIEMRQGMAQDEIMREARRGNYDLIIIGAASMDRLFQRLLVDRVTPSVVERSPCSVLVVR